MSNSVGSLVVEIAASTAKFEAGLSKMVAESSRQANEVKRVFSGLATAVAGSFGASFFVDLVKGSIDAADHLNDLSQMAGIAATEMGGIGYAAQMSGSDLQTVSDGLTKLNKSIAQAASGNKEMADTFSSMGISVLDSTGKVRLADDILKEVADKFEGYTEGPKRAALAMQLFGKAAGPELVQFLSGGSAEIQKNIDYYKKYSGISDEVIEKSAAFNDQLDKLKLVSGALGNELAATTLPALKGVVDLMLSVKESSEGALTQLNRWTTFKLNDGDAASQLGKVRSSIAAINAELAKTDHADRGLFSNEAFSADLKRQLGELEQQKKFLQEIEVKSALGRASSVDTTDTELFRFRKAKVEAPSGKDGGSTNTDDPAKKYLDNVLRDLDRANSEQASLLSDRNKMLEQYNGDYLLSFADYYAARKAVASEALQVQLANYDAEITALKDYQSRAAKATDKADAQGKINDLIDKKAKLQTDASQDSIAQLLKESKAYDDLAKQVRTVTADLLELQGQTAGASKIRIDDQFGDLTKRLSVNGNTEGLASLEKLKGLKVAQAEFNDLGEKGSKVFSELQQAEERAYISQQIGATGELATMQIVGIARQDAVTQLEAIVAAEVRVAEASDNPALIENAEKAKIALEKLKASADPLADRFDNLFKNTFADNLEGFINGTKSAEDAFASFGQSVINQLIKISAQEAASKIFSGGQGGGGGLGGLFSSISGLFSGGQGGGLDGGYNSNGFWDLSGARAAGGPVDIGKTYLVGEKGPELFVPGMSGGIVPNHAINKSGGGGAPVINIHSTYHVASGVRREDVIAIVEAGNEKTKAQILESMNRGGAYAR